MKKYINAILILTLLFAGMSCNSVLEEKSYDFVTPEQIQDSENGASQFVMGTYSVIANEFMNASSYLYLTNMDCDYASGASWAFGNVGAGNPTAFWGIDHLWVRSYVLIHRANMGISQISKMSNLTPKNKENYLGHLKFLKAWAYFQLVRNYGGVPILKQTITDGASLHNPRASVADVYAHIIELLEESKTMYAKGEEGAVLGLATKGAATALEAKVYATMASGALSGVEIIVKGGLPSLDEPAPYRYTAKTVAGYESFDVKKYYELARDRAKEVIAEYELFDDYSKIWDKSNRNLGEHIWMAQAKDKDKELGNTICRDYVGIFKSNGTLEGNWYGMRDHWYKLFEEDDLRVVDGVVHRFPSETTDSQGALLMNYYPKWYKDRVDNKESYDSEGNSYTGKEVYNAEQGWSLAKLTKFANVTSRSDAMGDFHFPLLRLPDIMLIYAEALNELNAGPTTEAYNEVNRIRTRSNASIFKNMNQIEFRSAVIEERARELAYEADRRYDLFRWGIYVEVMDAIDMDEHGVTKRRMERNLLYPIPTSEIDSNDEIDSNNPGW